MKKISSIKISKAKIDDAEGIQILTAEASKGMYELCGWSKKEADDHFSPEKIKDGAERLRKSIPDFTENDILFVAKDEKGRVVGLCFAEKQEKINRIEGVFISPEYQRVGLGRKLYDKAYGLLNRDNDTTLDVFSLNSKAINFYKKLGFVETGKKILDERFRDSKGKILEAIEMVLKNKNSINYFKDKKVVIMGLGLLGGALNDAIYLLKFGANLVITDMKTEKELASSVKKLKSLKKAPGSYILHLGGHRIDDFKEADFILQPGNVPVNSPYLLEAQKNNIPIHESESLFMANAQNIKIVGITGTRGKTTTTHLIYEILKEAFGKMVHLAGNVKGISTLALLDKVKVGDIVVLELDSWCLHGIGEIKKSPHISVFTNLMPDHLNFYLKGSKNEAEAMQKYFMDKAQIFANQNEDDFLILDKDIKKIIEERYKDTPIKSRVITINNTSEIKNWKLKIKGEYNYRHVLRAREVARILGVEDKVIKKVAENFSGVEGRQDFVREYKGIKIYNDTTATTPDATIAALQALGDKKAKKVVLLMGGADKGLDMSGLLKEIPRYCKKVILLSGTGSEKLEALHFIKSADLKEAVDKALSFCKKGDVFIFSPAYASFGMFKNEYDRGDKFVKIINNLK